jgi:CheY-like chemotaxis protein
MSSILVIEDDETVRMLYKRLFTYEKYEVHLASDGSDGLKLAQEVIPNLILLDILMPEMDGIEVLKQLKTDEKTRDITVLMLTNLGEESMIAQSVALGAAGYIVKAQYSPDQLLEEVKAKIEASHANPPQTTP